MLALRRNFSKARTCIGSKIKLIFYHEFIILSCMVRVCRIPLRCRSQAMLDRGNYSDIKLYKGLWIYIIYIRAEKCSSKSRYTGSSPWLHTCTMSNFEISEAILSVRWAHCALQEIHGQSQCLGPILNCRWMPWVQFLNISRSCQFLLQHVSMISRHVHSFTEVSGPLLVVADAYVVPSLKSLHLSYTHSKTIK